METYINQKEKRIMRGDIYYVVLPDTGESHVQKGTRPCVVVSNNSGNLFSGIIMVCPLTTKVKDLPTHFMTAVTGQESQVLCENIMVVDKTWVGDYVGRLNGGDIKKLNACLQIALSLGDSGRLEAERELEFAQRQYEEAQKRFQELYGEKDEEIYSPCSRVRFPEEVKNKFVQDWESATARGAKSEVAKKYGFNSYREAWAYWRRVNEHN